MKSRSSDPRSIEANVLGAEIGFEKDTVTGLLEEIGDLVAADISSKKTSAMITVKKYKRNPRQRRSPEETLSET